MAHYMRFGAGLFSGKLRGSHHRGTVPFRCSLLTDGKEDAMIMHGATCFKSAGGITACGITQTDTKQLSAVFLQRFFKQHGDHV